MSPQQGREKRQKGRSVSRVRGQVEKDHSNGMFLVAPSSSPTHTPTKPAVVMTTTTTTPASASEPGLAQLASAAVAPSSSTPSAEHDATTIPKVVIPRAAAAAALKHPSPPPSQSTDLLLQRNLSGALTTATTTTGGTVTTTELRSGSPSTQDDDDDGNTGSQKLKALGESTMTSKKFSEQHLNILNAYYKENPNPTAKYLRKIAERAGLTHLQCKAWFQYQRKKKRKHILENQSESLYREIKVLVEDLEKAKSRNVALLTENTELRKNVNQWNAYQDQLKPSQGAPSSSAAAAAAAAATDKDKTTQAASLPLPGREAKVQFLQNSIIGGVTQETSPTSEQTQYHQSHLLGLQGKPSLAAVGVSMGAGAQIKAEPSVLSQAPIQDPFASIQAALMRQQTQNQGGDPNLTKPLDVNNVDIPGQVARNATSRVKQASAVVTRVLGGETKNKSAKEAVLHSQVAIHVRTLLQQSENPMEIVTIVMQQIDAVLNDRIKAADAKEREIRLLLDSFVKTELASKDTQAAMKEKLCSQFPPLPSAPSVMQPNPPCTVCAESALCLFNMSYLGLGERSLSMMGETSLYALFVQAYDLINLEQMALPFDQIVALHKFREELKRREQDLVKRFETTWHLPYAFTERHRDPVMQTHLRTAMAAAAKDHPGEGVIKVGGDMVTRAMRSATEVYKEGVVKCYETLPPLLCARVFLAMHKVKHILRTSDAFYQLSAASS